MTTLVKAFEKRMCLNAKKNIRLFPYLLNHSAPVASFANRAKFLQALQSFVVHSATIECFPAEFGPEESSSSYRLQYKKLVLLVLLVVLKLCNLELTETILIRNARYCRFYYFSVAKIFRLSR